MKTKTVITNAKLADGKAVQVKSYVDVPTNMDELLSIAGLSLEEADTETIKNHLVDLFVAWCVAHTYQSQIRNTLKKASPTLNEEQLKKLVDSIPFRIPRPASAPRGDKITLKKSQLTADQIAKLREMGIL